MPRSAHRRTLSSVMAVLFVVSLSAYLGARPVAATTTLIGATQVATSLPPPATFNTNLLLAGSSNAAEPSIRTDRFGRSFVIAPTGLPAGCKAFRVTHDGSHRLLRARDRRHASRAQPAPRRGAAGSAPVPPRRRRAP